MKTASTPLLLTILLLAGALRACTQTALGAMPAAPTLQECNATPATELGAWDDAFVCGQEEVVVLRRNDELFTLSPTGSADLRKLTAAPALKNSTIVAGVGRNGRLWLFIQSSQDHPFAIDAHSGTISKFAIPGLNVPGSHAPGIQSHTIIRQSDAALLMIAGGDRATWPRDGNRPVYFWMSLKSGKVVQFPVGWDLDHFSADQRVAVFATPQEKQFEPRPLQAVELGTGDFLDGAPDRQTVGSITFDWSDRNVAKAYYKRRERTGAREYFAGLSVNGTVVPINVGMYVARDGGRLDFTAKSHGGFAAFSLRRAGDGPGVPSPFWIADLNEHDKPQLVANNVTDFALLDHGNCVFVTAGRGRNGESFEASVRQSGKLASWNVLDGVERMPELKRELAEKPYIEDKLTIRLIESFGRSHSQALCLFWHYRRDMRSGFPTESDPTVEPLSWRRAILVTASGERYLTDLFRGDRWPDRVWLHESGKLISGTDTWQTSGPERQRKIQLSEWILNPKNKE